MKKYGNTLRRLWRLQREHSVQFNAIDLVAGALKDDKVRFEVHFQCHWPDHRPVTAAANTIGDAYARAERKWKKLNKNSEHNHVPAANVFARFGAKLVLLDAKDALAIATAEDDRDYFETHFGGDPRLTQDVGRNVWNIREKLPGWHAKST